MKGVKLDGRVNVECIGGENRRYRLQKYLEANSVDTVLIAETWKHSSLIDAVWAKYLGFNVICREYSSYWFPYYSNQLQLMTEKQKVYSAVDALTCESENDKMLWRGTVPCIVEVLPGSVNAECDSENRVSRDNQLIFVGDVTHLNGRDFIPQIMSRISQKIKNVRLLVCGAFTSEGERYEFDQAVKNRGISENITVLGTVPNVCDRIKESRIVIRPTYAEEDSAAVDAALAFGVPVVVWNLTGRFGDQKEGVIRAEKFNGDAFADAVVNLLKDEAAWKLASENCLKGAARRSSENILNKWKCLFKKIQEGNTERNGSLLPPEVLNSINAGQEAIEYYLANHVHKRPVEYRDVIHEVVREVPCRYIPDDQLVKIRRYDKLKKVFDSLCPAGTKRKEIARSFVLAVGKKLVR
jgi:glycosyltransferase involved in cell wall biosynthesis